MHHCGTALILVNVSRRICKCVPMHLDPGGIREDIDARLVIAIELSSPSLHIASSRDFMHVWCVMPILGRVRGVL